MADPSAAAPRIRRLVADLVEAPEPDPALAGLPAWLAASPRFRAFAEANRDKIRKKLRGATATEARLDVRAELRVAALVLADRRFELEFEAYGAGRRGPDFTATFRAGRPFNVEVTRRRPGPGAASLEPSILGKLRQLPPSASNVLVVAVDGPDGAPDPGPVLRDLRARADRRDDAFFAARGLGGAAAVNAGLLRMAAVVAWAESGSGAARVTAWANTGARIPLPQPTLRALLAALAAE
ncbi:MAG: hypothetical protein AB1627_08560 [Chloroflexota bacterium]